MRIVAITLISLLMTTVAFGQDSKADDGQSEGMSVDDGFSTMTLDFKSHRPFFRPLGGVTSWSLTDAADIESSVTLGAILGFESTKNIKNSSVAHTESNGFYFTYHMAGENQPDKYSVSAWRFGFNTAESYGYRFSDEGEAGVYLGSTKAPLSWYSVSVDNAPAGLAGSSALGRFPDALRFGEAATANIDVRVAGPVSVNLGYEWAQVYERHMFWFWGGSAIIEGIADGAMGWFTRAIGKNAPAALPIMHFILKNGVAMGFKALRMEQMNWPFTTVAPLNIQTYSIGVNVVF